MILYISVAVTNGIKWIQFLQIFLNKNILAMLDIRISITAGLRFIVHKIILLCKTYLFRATKVYRMEGSVLICCCSYC